VIEDEVDCAIVDGLWHAEVTGGGAADIADGTYAELTAVDDGFSGVGVISGEAEDAIDGRAVVVEYAVHG